jgi:hypothetical protein
MDWKLDQLNIDVEDDEGTEKRVDLVAVLAPYIENAARENFCWLSAPHKYFSGSDPILLFLPARFNSSDSEGEKAAARYIRSECLRNGTHAVSKGYIKKQNTLVMHCRHSRKLKCCFRLAFKYVPITTAAPTTGPGQDGQGDNPSTAAGRWKFLSGELRHSGHRREQQQQQQQQQENFFCLAAAASITAETPPVHQDENQKRPAAADNEDEATTVFIRDETAIITAPVKKLKVAAPPVTTAPVAANKNASVSSSSAVAVTATAKEDESSSSAAVVNEAKNDQQSQDESSSSSSRERESSANTIAASHLPTGVLPLVNAQLKDDDSKRWEVHDAVLKVHMDLRSSYSKAYKGLGRVFVWTESDPLVFLRSANGNVPAAAQKLYMYWSKREEYFGEQAFGPMLHALTQADMNTRRNDDFCLEFVSLLPSLSVGGGVGHQEAVYKINASTIDRCLTPGGFRAIFYQLQLHLAFSHSQMAGGEGRGGECAVVLVVVASSQHEATTRDLEIFFGHLRDLAADYLPIKVARVEIESSPTNPPPSLMQLLTLRGVVQKWLNTLVVIKRFEGSPCFTPVEFSAQHPSFKTKLDTTFQQFPPFAHKDASKRHQMPGLVVRARSLAGPSLQDELSKWPEEDQQLFKRAFASLESLHDKRKWIKQRILGVLSRGMNLFSLPIENTDYKYMLILTKIEFAWLVGITCLDDVPILFGIHLKFVPKVLLHALSQYHMTTPVGSNKAIDWPAVVSYSRLLANSSIEYVKDVFGSDEIRGIVFMTGKEVSTNSRPQRFLDKAGGRAVPIVTDALLRLLDALYAIVRTVEFRRVFLCREFFGIQLVSGKSPSSFGESVAAWFRLAGMQECAIAAFLKEYKAGIKEMDERLKREAQSMFNLEELTGNDDTNDIKIHASILCSKVGRAHTQDAHADYQRGTVANAAIGFLPLSPFALLQGWTKPMEEVERGTLLSIPRHLLVLFPKLFIHGGGFQAAVDADVTDDGLSNFRIHFYIHKGVTTEEKKNDFTTYRLDIKTKAPCIDALCKNIINCRHQEYKEPSRATS